MTDFPTTMQADANLTTEEQKQAGMPIAGSMDAAHREFMQNIKQLVESKDIDPYNPQTFLNQSVYDSLPDEWKEKTDITLINIATLLKYIYEFYTSKETPDESPMYATMIDQLWQMKQSIEAQYDVFKF